MRALKTIAILLTLLLLAAFFGGCGGTDDVIADGDADVDGDGEQVVDGDEPDDGDVDGDADGDADGDTDGDEEQEPTMVYTTTAQLRLSPTLDDHGGECEDPSGKDYCENPGPAMPDMSVYLDYGMGQWTVEEGESFTLNEDLGFTRGETGDRRSLAVWGHFSDVHITDEESPNRMAALDSRAIPSALRPMDIYSEIVLDAAVRTMNYFSSMRPFDLVVVSGDLVDSAQTNEFLDFMGVMNGEEVDPDSGEDDDPVEGPDNDPQDPFTAAGLDAPWIFNFGNHDALILGNWVVNEDAVDTAIGDVAPAGTRDGQTYEVIGMYGPVAADQERAPLTHEETIELFLNAEGEPAGHGLSQDNLMENTAYYTYDLPDAPLLRFIALDTAFRPLGFEGAGTGASYVDAVIDLDQFDWLIDELDRAEEEKKLVIMSQHHADHKLQDDNLPERFITTEELVTTIQRYPNVLVQMVGHSHENTVWAHPLPDSDGGFFEVQASSLTDWPQQMRFYELVDNGNGTLSVFTVVVNHQNVEGSMTEYARVLSLIDAQSGWGEGGHGISIERNVEMVFNVPEGFEEAVSGASGGEVQALGNWVE